LTLIEEAVLLKLSKAITASLEQAADLTDGLAPKIKRLENKSISIRLKGLPIFLEYFVIFEQPHITISSINQLHNTQADLAITLSIGSLIRAKLTSLEHVIRDRDIEMKGDLNIAMELQSIFNSLEIDFKQI